jgi:hypothetical protein
MVSAEILTKRRQLELAVAAFVTDSYRNEAAQDTPECHGVSFQHSAKLDRGTVALQKEIGQTKLRSNVEDLSRLGAERRVEKRRDRLLRVFRICHCCSPRFRVTPIGLTHDRTSHHMPNDRTN